MHTLRDIFFTSREALEDGSIDPAVTLTHVFNVARAQLTRSDHEQAQLTRSGYESVLDMPNEAYNGGAGASGDVGDIVKARRKGRRREREHLGVDRPGLQRRMRETNAAIQVGANAEAEFGGDGHIQD